MFHSWSFCGHVHWSRQTSTTVSCQEDFIAYCKTNRFYSSGVNRALYLCVMATQCLQRKIAMHIGCRCRGAGSRCRRGSLCEGTAASGRSHKAMPQWPHHRAPLSPATQLGVLLWNSIYGKGQKMVDKQWGVWQEVWETALWPPWSEKEGRRDCPTACGESMHVLLTGAVACGEPTLE